MNKLKAGIELQISKTNKAFLSFRGKLFYDGLQDDEIESLKLSLNKITKQFKGYRILSIILYVFLITVSTLNFLDVIAFGKMSQIAPFIVISLSSFWSTYTFYKLKVNLEHKIYLLTLLSKIETE
jgi:ABC-type phosphate/phosphonate transport system permease subunit